MRGYAEFNKFSNTGARMQDSVYHMTLKSHFTGEFCTKTSRLISVLENATFLWTPTHSVTT